MITDAIANELIPLLSELVDETALDKPRDWESLNYEAMKLVAITHTLELCKDVVVTDATLNLMAIVSYLLIENTQLHVENLQLGKG